MQGVAGKRQQALTEIDTNNQGIEGERTLNRRTY
jgi:hypothetical protein